MPWALTAVAWVQSALPEEHPQPVPVTDCNDVACVAASNAGEPHRQTRIGAILAAGMHDESPQYICADDSKRTRCPRVAAQLGASPLNLTMPSHARWLFEGPSYMQEIYDTLVAANGGCRSSRGGRLSTSEAAVLTPPHAHWRPRANGGDGVDTKGSTFDHGGACHLPNGAVVAYLNGERVRGFVRKHAWTHGFFMQPHNKKYRIEHERAAAEGDEVDEKAFADTQGKDMCLPQEVIYAVDTYRGTESTFGAYVECMRAHSQSTDKHGRATSYTLAGFEDILPEEARLMLLVPWHVPWPTEGLACNSCDGGVAWHNLTVRPLKTAPYFARDRVLQYDCRAKQVLSEVQDPTLGYKVRDRSRAEENAADSEHPGIMDHQCVAVCNGSDHFHDCFPGPVAWIAHDLLELAEFRQNRRETDAAKMHKMLSEASTAAVWRPAA